MLERQVSVDHSTVNRWVIKYSPRLEAEFHRRKRPVWVSWRLDETYIKVKGEWVYLYRAADKFGKTIDFLLTEQRDQKAAKRFLTKAIRRNGTPEKINIDKSEETQAPSSAIMPSTRLRFIVVSETTSSGRGQRTEALPVKLYKLELPRDDF